MQSPEPVPADGQPDILSARGSQLLGALWILLFTIRGLLIPPLVYYGLLPGSVLDWDSGPLLWAYAALLLATIVVLALRAVRGAPAPSSAGRAARRD
jgi:hypothetical protein